MHPSRGIAMSNVSNADSRGQQLCEKKDYCDSANSDSGFLSGNNLNSSEITGTEESSSSENNPSYPGASTAPAPSVKQVEEPCSNVDSGMIQDEEPCSRDIGLSDICERLDRLMKRDETKFFLQDEMNETQLHLAVYERNDELIAKMVTNIPRHFLDIQNDDGQTALHLAVVTGQSKIVRRLLHAGTDQSIRDVDGNTALHLASGTGNVNIVKELLAQPSFNEITVQGVYPTKVPLDMESWNYDGKTCVHLAAEAGSIEVIRSLVDAGANINAREGKSGMSPLHISIRQGNAELANFLLDECPQLSLEAVTYAGLTAYQLALIQDKSILIGNLAKHGAEPISPPESDAETDSDDEMISNYYGASTFSAAYSGLSAINVS